MNYAQIAEIWNGMPNGDAGFMKEWGYMQFAHALLEADPRPKASDPVGEAGSMPGTDGFTMLCFRAVDVPIGTKLYKMPTPVEPTFDRDSTEAWMLRAQVSLKKGEPGAARIEIEKALQFLNVALPNKD